MRRAALLAILLAACAAPAPPARPAAKPAATAEPAAAPIDRRAAACGDAPAPAEAPAPRAPPDARLGVLIAPPPQAKAAGAGARVGAAGASPEGPTKGTVARVEVRGSALLAPGALDGKLAVKPGAPLDPALVLSDLRRLWALGIFEDVSAATESLPDGKLALVYLLRDRPRIGEVFVEGAARLTREEILKEVDLDGPDMLHSAARLRWIRDGLAARYRVEGHSAAEINVQARPFGDRVDVCIRVAEGPRVTIARWSFTGNQVVSEAELRGLMVTEGGRYNAPGGIFHEEAAEVDLLRISAHYYDRGMIEVQVGPLAVTPSPDGGSLSVEVPIREGPVFQVGRVAIDGSPRAKRYQRDLPIRSGQVFVRSRLAQEIARLKEQVEREEQRQVDVSPDLKVDPASRKVDLTLHIADRTP